MYVCVYEWLLTLFVCLCVWKKVIDSCKYIKPDAHCFLYLNEKKLIKIDNHENQKKKNYYYQNNRIIMKWNEFFFLLDIRNTHFRNKEFFSFSGFLQQIFIEEEKKDHHVRLWQKKMFVFWRNKKHERFDTSNIFDMYNGNSSFASATNDFLLLRWMKKLKTKRNKD